MVTHDQQLASKASRNIQVLDGKVLEHDSPKPSTKQNKFDHV
jgi:ABC-type lipoprotein export system ATPase subunit